MWTLGKKFNSWKQSRKVVARVGRNRERLVKGHKLSVIR